MNLLTIQKIANEIVNHFMHGGARVSMFDFKYVVDLLCSSENKELCLNLTPDKDLIGFVCVKEKPCNEHVEKKEGICKGDHYPYHAVNVPYNDNCNCGHKANNGDLLTFGNHGFCWVYYCICGNYSFCELCVTRMDKESLVKIFCNEDLGKGFKCTRVKGTCEKHPIDSEKKEEQCTKCVDGRINTMAPPFVSTIKCPHCKGKEPRKENNIDCSKPIAIGMENYLAMQGFAEENMSKLSIALSALEKLKLELDDFECSCGQNINNVNALEIIHTALSEIQESEKQENITRNIMEHVYPEDYKDQQKPQSYECSCLSKHLGNKSECPVHQEEKCEHQEGFVVDEDANTLCCTCEKVIKRLEGTPGVIERFEEECGNYMADVELELVESFWRNEIITMLQGLKRNKITPPYDEFEKGFNDCIEKINAQIDTLIKSL